MRRNRRNVRCGLCPALQKRTHRLQPAKLLLRRRNTDSQSFGLALTARSCALQNCMSLIPKTKRDAESGPLNSNNSFIFNKLAERVGFEPTLPFRVNTLSKRAPSATRPSLRRRCCYRKVVRLERRIVPIERLMFALVLILWCTEENRNFTVTSPRDDRRT
jgi:hypothetical protein